MEQLLLDLAKESIFGALLVLSFIALYKMANRAFDSEAKRVEDIKGQIQTLMNLSDKWHSALQELKAVNEQQKNAMDSIERTLQLLMTTRR